MVVDPKHQYIRQAAEIIATPFAGYLKYLVHCKNSDLSLSGFLCPIEKAVVMHPLSPGDRGFETATFMIVKLSSTGSLM